MGSLLSTCLTSTRLASASVVSFENDFLKFLIPLPKASPSCGSRLAPKTSTMMNKILIGTVIVSNFASFCDAVYLMNDMWVDEDIEVVFDDMFAINV